VVRIAAAAAVEFNGGEGGLEVPRDWRERERKKERKVTKGYNIPKVIYNIARVCLSLQKENLGRDEACI